VDGTIPGPSGFGGTVKGGAAVSIADLAAGTCETSFSPAQCGADSVAYIAAHEGGHWLGLYHTSEQDGETFDPLADTAACKCQACVPAAQVPQCGASTVVLGANCSQGTQVCGAASNLMFWLLDANSHGLVSPQQGTIMRLDPAVH
jgi:hypothetical protein